MVDLGYLLWIDTLKYSFPKELGISLSYVFYGGLSKVVSTLDVMKTAVVKRFRGDVGGVEGNVGNVEVNNVQPVNERIEVKLENRFKPNDNIEIQIEEKLD